MGLLTGFFNEGVALNGKDLADKGKVEVIVQGGRSPDRT